MTRIKDLLEKNWHEQKEARLKCLEYLFQKISLFYIISTSLWYLYLINSEAKEGLGKNLTDFLYTHWIEPIFSKIETGSIPLLFIIALSLLIGLYFIAKAIRQYVYSGKSILFYSFLILNYSSLRFTSNVWEIKSIAKDGFFGHFAYWDLIFILLIPICFRFIKWCLSFIKIQNYITRGLVVIIPAWNKIKKTFKKPKQKSNQETTETKLILEREITDKADDILNRTDIAEKIATILNDLPNLENAFAVGITAPWGYGKTSFLNFLNLELKEQNDKAIFIKFSPWYCKTKADIISLFFDSLSDGLKPYHSSINNQIEKYAKLLLAAHKNQVSGAINKAFDLFSKPKDIRSIYEQIDTSIGDLNRKIYITIDDLDRLYTKEIIECFKIIRNTANFKNIVFIVAYDPSYVNNALKEGLKNNYKGYIDKIIQLPFSLPRIEDSKLHNYIKSKLISNGLHNEEIAKIFNPSYHENTQHRLNITYKYKLTDYFTNIRDCNKILNIFFTYRKLLGDEVIQSELFFVCILRTLYSTETLEIYTEFKKYFIFGEQIQFKDTIKWEDRKRAERESPSRKIEPVYSIYKLNKDEDFINLVQTIFLRPEKNNRNAARNNNFKTYYNGLVSEEKIKYADFEKWIKSTEDLIKQIDILNKIGTDLSNDKLYNLNEKLSGFTPQNKVQAQIILHGLFYLDGELNGVIPMLFDYKDDYIEILNQILNHKLKIPLKGIARRLADIKFGIIDSGDDSEYKRAFKLEDLKALSLKTLKRKIARGIIDTDSDYTDILDIYWNCAYDRETDALKIDEKANKLMKDFAKKHAVSYIKNLETTVNHPSSKLTRRFHYSIDQIFSDKIGDYEPFDTFLKETIADNSNDAELKQIEEYWDAFKESGYKSYELKEQEIAEKKQEEEVIN